MPRTIQLSLPPNEREKVVESLRGRDGILAMSLQPDAGIEPPGDVLTLRVTNTGAKTVFRTIEEFGLPPSATLASSEPLSLIVPGRQEAIDHDTNEAPWEEVAALLRRDTNLSHNYLGLMLLAGAIAAAGIRADTIHIVVGAMLVAPGFEPMMRTIFALVAARGRGLLMGLATTAAGYACLAVGAAAGHLVLRAASTSPPVPLAERALVEYWTTFGPSDVFVAVSAGVAGALILSARRTVFAAGVMVALALVPAMSIAGMALVSGEMGLAWQGLLRWLLDTVCIDIAAAVTFGLKHLFLHRRPSLESTQSPAGE